MSTSNDITDESFPLLSIRYSLAMLPFDIVQSELLKSQLFSCLFKDDTTSTGYTALNS
jgi:hypothetical protein